MRWISPVAASRVETGLAPGVKERIRERLHSTAPSTDPEEDIRRQLAPEVVRALYARPLTRAAVLLLLCDRPQGLTLLLTRRTDILRDHPGQISFPGGRIDPGDAGPLAAALREAQEELGIEPALIEVAGYLSSHPVVTGFAVTPVVGFLPADCALQPDPTEVAEVFEVPLAFLADPGNLHTGLWPVAEVEVRVCEYRYGGHRIWGATAGMIEKLVNLLR